jgi:inhibitor of KinA sporulation pathway (predicted exonuclease)
MSSSPHSSVAKGIAHTRSKIGSLACDFLIVVDVEATCKKGLRHPQSFLSEIIEFPAVMVRCSDGEILDEFQSYVRPSTNTSLSPFCKVN